MPDFFELIDRLDLIEAAPATDEAMEEAGALVSAVIEMPAPSPAALLWKLHYLLAAGEHGATGAWEGNFIAQTLADCDQFLGEVGRG